MGFSDNEGKPGNFAEQYNSRREHHLSSLQQKEEEMRQKFVIRVKEKEAELKEAEKEVRIVVWSQLWNFIVRQVEFNKFSQPNEHPQRIFLYLARLFDWKPSKIGHIFTK